MEHETQSIEKKKFLGQNFLNNKNILGAMARAAELTKHDVVLEVGPGLGSLTEILAMRAKKVIAVEKDPELVTWNMKHGALRKTKNVSFIHGDILKPETWLPQFNASRLMLHTSCFKIVANIPYYITSHFLRLFLSETKFRPKLMVLMVQKEVAERILAKNGKESMLSLSVKAYGKPEFIRKVPRGVFSPPPKVDSAIIKITTFGSPLKVRGARGVMKIDPEKVLSISRLAFQKKRKMLRQSIGKKIQLPKKFQTKRPEELSPEDWELIVGRAV